MSSPKIDVQQVVAQIKSWLFEIAGIALLFMLALTAAKAAGLPITWRSIGHVEIAYLCIAYAALRFRA
jgi:hypothetical protein